MLTSTVSACVIALASVAARASARAAITGDPAGPRHAERIESIHERSSRHAEELRGAGLIAAARGKCFEHALAFELGDLIADLLPQRARVRTRWLGGLRHVIGLDLAIAREQYRALEHVTKLADVAGPRVRV